MKNLFFMVLTFSVMSSQAFAGIPTTQCSTANAGIRVVTEMPGIESLVIKLDRRGNLRRISLQEVTMTASNVQIISQTTGTMGSHSKIYSATLTAKMADGSAMPAAYTENLKDDGSLEFVALCEFSVF